MKPVFSKIANWKPARVYPMTYPGERPDTSYLIVEDTVFLLNFEDPAEVGSAYFFNEHGKKENLDSFLKKNGVPTLEERYAVLAYGANRNPATISIKFSNYNYKSPGKKTIIPLLKGRLADCDVVACNIYGQGYMYANLLIDSAYTQGTQVESWINLCDQDQLRALNDSEGIENGRYVLAQFPGFTIDGHQRALAPLGYAGVSEIFVSPARKEPVAYGTVNARDRKLVEMDAPGMMEHLIHVSGLEKDIRAISGIANGYLPVELAKYLNEQWWYHFNTGEQPMSGYLKILQLLEQFVKENSMAVSTKKVLEGKGMLVQSEECNDPGDASKLKNLLA